MSLSTGEFEAHLIVVSGACFLSNVQFAERKNVMANFSNESDPGTSLTEYYKHSGILKEL